MLTSVLCLATGNVKRPWVISIRPGAVTRMRISSSASECSSSSRWAKPSERWVMRSLTSRPSLSACSRWRSASRGPCALVVLLPARRGDRRRRCRDRQDAGAGMLGAPHCAGQRHQRSCAWKWLHRAVHQEIQDRDHEPTETLPSDHEHGVIVLGRNSTDRLRNRYGRKESVRVVSSCVRPDTGVMKRLEAPTGRSLAPRLGSGLLLRPQL
jgi:hypothetical protein